MAFDFSDKQTNKQTLTVIRGYRDESDVCASTEPFHQTTTKRSGARSGRQTVYKPWAMSN